MNHLLITLLIWKLTTLFCCLKRNIETNIIGRKILGNDAQIFKNSVLRNTLSHTGLPMWLTGKESTCHCRRCKRCGFDPWVGKIPWRRRWQPILVFLPGESHRQRKLEQCSPWGCKESDMTEHNTHTSYMHDIECMILYILYRNYLTLLSGTSFQVLLRDVLQTCFHFTLHNIKMLPQKPKELHDMKSYCLYSDMAKYCLHFWISPIVTCGFLWEIVN